MDRIANVATTVTYSAAGITTVHSVLTYFSPHEWQAIGVLGGLAIAAFTSLINTYFRAKESKRKRERNERD